MLRMNGKDYARPDIVLFVNGIPLAVIECKDASVPIIQAISQNIRNQKPDYIPQLFKFIQIVMAANKMKRNMLLVVHQINFGQHGMNNMWKNKMNY